MPADSNKFLIVRTDAIGDLLLSEPVAQIIKSKFPKGKIIFMVSRYAAPILFNNPNIDDLILFTKKDLSFKPSRIGRAVKLIRRGNSNVAIVLRPTWFNAITTYLARVPIRIGTGYRAYSVFFNKRIYEHRKRNIKSEMEYNLSLLTPLGVSISSETAKNIIPKIYLKEEEKNKAKRILNGLGLKDDEIPIVVHPGGRGSAPRWKLGNFFELLNRLCLMKGIKPIITGLPSDFDKMQLNKLRELVIKNGSRIIDLLGKINLRMLMGVIALSKLAVSNSTGTSHIAAALGTPLVTIYPDKADFSLRRWSPIGKREDNIKIISAANINDISVDRVLRDCLYYLGKF